uniref:Ovule protein n=1 Tax=Haemonchus contortus TaxID=6289 RepID=A0A7I4YRB7_HAECO
RWSLKSDASAHIIFTTIRLTSPQKPGTQSTCQSKSEEQNREGKEKTNKKATMTGIQFSAFE